MRPGLLWLAMWLLLPLTSPLRAGEAAKADASKSDEVIRPQEEVIRLFDGESLDAFYTWMKDTKYEDPRDVFRVTDGLMHITGDGLGGLVSKQAYADYHLVLEYKWGPRTWQNRKDRTKDSGLLIHSIGPDGGYSGTWMSSLEVQIIEGGVGDFILVAGVGEDGKPIPIEITCETARDRDGEVIWKAGGERERFDLTNRKRINWYGRDPDWEDKLGFRGDEDVDSPGDAWTRLDVVCDGPHVEVFVNGVKVNEGFEANPAAGRLQLQTEMAEIFVRRWELWPIDKGPKPAKAE